MPQFEDSTPGKQGREVDTEGGLKVGSTAAFFLSYPDGCEFATNWYIGTIVARPRHGKYADVAWSNGDPKLWMDVSDNLRGTRWVILKHEESDTAAGAVADAVADADADAHSDAEHGESPTY